MLTLEPRLLLQFLEIAVYGLRVQAEPPTTTDPEYTLNTQPIRYSNKV
jgi:hypothetical protein